MSSILRQHAEDDSFEQWNLDFVFSIRLKIIQIGDTSTKNR